MLGRYRTLPRSIVRLLVAQFLLSTLNAAIMLVFNLRLRQLGFTDPEIAEATSYRFLAILVLALPLGIAIRGRRLRPLFIFASLVVPGASAVAVHQAELRSLVGVALGMATWGIGMMAFQVGTLPYLVRKTTLDNRAEAISLSFATWSLSLVTCGAAIHLLDRLGELRFFGWAWTFDSEGILYATALLGLGALPLVWGIDDARPARTDLFDRRFDYDWKRILQAETPALLIAVGAGLTIPFMNLFFNAVFDLTPQEFSLLGAGTGVLVFVGSLLNPSIRRRFGYRIAILLAQSLAVCFLVLLALTELYSHWSGALGVAIACYLLRQPLMNMAGPITSDLALSYVGEKNRELISALGATIWSGSWFLSHQLFELLRRQGFPYWKVFLITAGLYGMGIIGYALLIRAHHRQVDLEPIEPEPSAGT